ncbi:MAG: hypothetical protein QOJ01_194, partial [Solirubrobacterales bacterium]|nr:hypothetical protein [Solirubrobacterales bacterium]
RRYLREVPARRAGELDELDFELD